MRIPIARLAVAGSCTIAAWGFLAGPTGCARPFPATVLQPASGDRVWAAGRAVVWQDKDGVRVATAFEQQQGRVFTLRVEVDNQSAERLDIDPSNITFNTCRGEGVDSCAPALHVIDPEQMLAGLNQAELQGAASDSNRETAHGVGLMLSAIAGERSDDTLYLEGEIASDREARGVAAARETWSNIALRRTTLAPGSAAGGNVYLPIDLHAGYVWLQIRIGQRLFSFPFRQDVDANWARVWGR
jgi:hypothetical protein